MQKGPDGNYHTGWVNEMMWNNRGFFAWGEVYAGGSGGGGNTFYNFQGISSGSVLNQMNFGDKFKWNEKKMEYGFWRVFSFDPISKGYIENASSTSSFAKVAVGST
ncbi:MAG TPA: hypothetical protein PKE38_16970, partial [Ignavibacteriaceae bacterium]|nr:hypothetical protein [Ignavibacteriaceae bacterium]